MLWVLFIVVFGCFFFKFSALGIFSLQKEYNSKLMERHVMNVNKEKKGKCIYSFRLFCLEYASRKKPKQNIKAPLRTLKAFGCGALCRTKMACAHSSEMRKPTTCSPELYRPFNSRRRHRLPLDTRALPFTQTLLRHMLKNKTFYSSMACSSVCLPARVHAQGWR